MPIRRYVFKLALSDAGIGRSACDTRCAREYPGAAQTIAGPGAKSNASSISAINQRLDEALAQFASRCLAAYWVN
jgi:hypothetical protein